MNETSWMTQASHLQRSAGEGTTDLFSSTNFLCLNGNTDTCKQVSLSVGGVRLCLVFESK